MVLDSMFKIDEEKSILLILDLLKFIKNKSDLISILSKAKKNIFINLNRFFWLIS